jgi:alpha-L-rhamnosidase
MNSFNHYAYGAIGDWMYRVIAGLDTYVDEPGYKHIRIQPHIGGGLSYASASLQTSYGKLSSGWKIEADKILFDIEIPPNTIADVFLPGTAADAVSESGNPLSSIPGTMTIEKINGSLQLKGLGSGVYHFSVKK